MNFTDRFIKLPIELYNKKEAEIIGYDAKTKYSDSFFMINPFDITRYRAVPKEEEGNEEESEQTIIYFRDGESCYIKLPIDEFEKLLNKFS